MFVQEPLYHEAAAQCALSISLIVCSQRTWSFLKTRSLGLILKSSSLFIKVFVHGLYDILLKLLKFIFVTQKLVQLLNFEELKNLGDVRKRSSAHVRHSFCLLDALLNGDQICLVVIICHHGVLHPLKILLDFALTFAESFEQEYLLLGQGFCLLLQVLLPE